MRTISYNSIRLTLLEFKQRRMALVHSTKMLVLLFLAGFSWQPAVADTKASIRVENSSTHVYGKNKPAATTSAVYWTTVQLLTASGSTTEVKSGDQIRYTIHIQNTGTDPIVGLKFVDTIPANTTFLPGSGPAGSSAPAGVFNYTYPSTLLVGSQPITISFLVTVNNSLPITVNYISHTSYVDLGDGTLLTVPAASGGTPPVYPEYAINTTVDNGIKAVAWKTQDYIPTGANGYVQAGDSIHYTIWVRNTGQVALTNVLVTDYVPTYTGFIRALDGGTFDSPNKQVSWTIPSLPVGGQVSVTFVVRVSIDLTGATSIENTAYVNINDGKPAFATVPVDPVTGTDPSPLPTTGPSTKIPVKSINSFQTWKVWLNENDNTATTVGPGEEITFFIYVRNTGNVSIPSLNINDNIPIGTTFKDVKDGGSFNAGDDNNSVNWEVNNIAAGAVATVHFTVTVDQHLEGLKNITNTAKVDNGDTTLETLGCDPQNPACNGKKGTVIPLAGTRADLFVSNVVTPNNDGRNDFFIVRGITDTKYRNSALYVYNRWGNEVYHSKDYNNNWGATGLSEGTYYYIFDLNDDGKIKRYQGWVMIIR